MSLGEGYLWIGRSSDFQTVCWMEEVESMGWKTVTVDGQVRVDRVEGSFMEHFGGQMS